MKQTKAVIFDMDGVLVDNNPFHKQAWAQYCKVYQIPMDENVFFQKAWGKTNEDILGILYDGKFTPAQIKEHAEIKEGMYRDIYKTAIKPLNGLYAFLEELKINNIKLGVATSAPKSNLDFVLESLSIRHYFEALIDDSQISKGKPSPEVYLKAAEKLHVDPENCLAFEDSFFGIESARSAGIRVIGITTTHTNEELTGTEFNIPDFSHVSLIDIRKIC